MTRALELPVPASWQRAAAIARGPARIILSFDVEEHHCIEAASGLVVEPALQAHYRARLEPQTLWLLEQLEAHKLKATFFLVGQIARHSPRLVRTIAAAGHEIGCHSWDHRRVHRYTPDSFREDVRISKDVLEQVSGEAVLGYRAPTFSITRQTAWAIEVLGCVGMVYDSSIYPVHHDRYGVPEAPRAPFRVRCEGNSLLEIPPATLRFLGANLPVGGGGYFRLLPLFLLERALWQVEGECDPSVFMLYFHPWEFDSRQIRLPLPRLNRFRTYVGIHRNRSRLVRLIERHSGHRFARAIDVARELNRQNLPVFDLSA